MARGNQRDKAREKNLKAAAGQVCPCTETLQYDIQTNVCTEREEHCMSHESYNE
jgi:hypothetical protein